MCVGLRLCVVNEPTCAHYYPRWYSACRNARACPLPDAPAPPRRLSAPHRPLPRTGVVPRELREPRCVEPPPRRHTRLPMTEAEHCLVTWDHFDSIFERCMFWIRENPVGHYTFRRGWAVFSDMPHFPCKISQREVGTKTSLRGTDLFPPSLPPPFFSGGFIGQNTVSFSHFKTNQPPTRRKGQPVGLFFTIFNPCVSQKKPTAGFRLLGLPHGIEMPLGEGSTIQCPRSVECFGASRRDFLCGKRTTVVVAGHKPLVGPPSAPGETRVQQRIPKHTQLPEGGESVLKGSCKKGGASKEVKTLGLFAFLDLRDHLML